MTSLASKRGPFLMGSLVASALAGLVVQNACIYFVRYKRDPWAYKATVGLLTAASLVAWAGYAQVVWFDYISSVDEAAEARPDPTRTILYVAPASANLFSESFFAWRSFRLSGGKWYVGCALAVLVAATFAAWLVTISLRKNGLSSTGIAAGGWETWNAVALWLASFTDISMTTILFYFMWPQRRGFNERTDSLIARILVLSVTTAAISSVLYTLDACVLLAGQYIAPIADFQEAPGACLTHVSALMVIGTLNLRDALKITDRATSTSGRAVHISSNSGSGSGSGSSKKWNKTLSLRPSRDVESGVQHDKPLEIALPERNRHPSQPSAAHARFIERGPFQNFAPKPWEQPAAEEMHP